MHSGLYTNAGSSEQLCLAHQVKEPSCHLPLSLLLMPFPLQEVLLPPNALYTHLAVGCLSCPLEHAFNQWVTPFPDQHGRPLRSLPPTPPRAPQRLGLGALKPSQCSMPPKARPPFSALLLPPSALVLGIDQHGKALRLLGADKGRGTGRGSVLTTALRRDTQYEHSLGVNAPHPAPMESNATTSTITQK